MCEHWHKLKSTKLRPKLLLLATQEDCGGNEFSMTLDALRGTVLHRSNSLEAVFRPP